MKKILAVALAFSALVSCKKEITELPPATQTGANTFGATVAGELWTPQGFGVAATAPILEARFGGPTSVFINARNFGSSPTETEFEIYLKNIVAPGTYLLNQNTGKYPDQTASYGYYIKRRFNPLNEYITSASHTGKVEVTRYDVANKIISGTFEFTAADQDDASQTVTVTEGRFDVTIQ